MRIRYIQEIRELYYSNVMVVHRIVLFSTVEVQCGNGMVCKVIVLYGKYNKGWVKYCDASLCIVKAMCRDVMFR